jgi:hypothetical protein
MSVILGGLPLPNLWIDGEFEPEKHITKTATTPTGRVLIWRKAAPEYPMDLVGSENAGWIQRADLATLREMARDSVHYDLDLHGDLYRVRFRLEDPPVVSAEPIVPRSAPEPTDYYKNLAIKLMAA